MKECFIVKDGAEQKAELEDVIPLIDENREFREIIFRYNEGSNLSGALAYIPAEMKDKIYRNMSPRISGSLNYYVKLAESRNDKNSDYIQRAKKNLIEFFGKHRGIWLKEYQEQIVWKGADSNEINLTETPSDPVKKFIKQIEKACNSGYLYISTYGIRDIAEENIKKAFAAFNNRYDELKKIRSLSIPKKNLYTTALLFEKGAIEELIVSDDFHSPWPSFLEKYTALTSITIYPKLTEFPSWIRNSVSLRHLSIDLSINVFIPDWIGDMQSLTGLSLGGYQSHLKLPDSIGNLKNLVKLQLGRTCGEKLPESIGNLQYLKELSLNYYRNKNLPDSIGNLKNLAKFELHDTYIEKLPDSIGNLQSLTKLSLVSNENLESLPNSMGNLQSLKELSLKYNKNLKYLPDTIGNLQSLTKLLLESNENLENLPNSIGNLQSLTEIEFKYNKSLKYLPDTIGNLKNLVKFELHDTFIEKLPDNIGNLQSLTEIELKCNRSLKYLPDTIGNLKNLVKLSLCNSHIEKLPDTIINCTLLEHVNICGTYITSVPAFISSVKRFYQSTILIPNEKSISYSSFCNSYYKIVQIVLWFNEVARREGLLSLEDNIEGSEDDFFHFGIRLVVDGTDYCIIRNILTIKIEHEHDFYKKKLMEIAMEGILYIQEGRNMIYTAFMLASFVDIKNNPLNAACTEYLKGNCNAFENINFRSAIRPEEEREEVRFIKRAVFLINIARTEGFLALEKHLDHDGIARRDIFEYTLPLVIDRWDKEIIATILDRLIAHETNPVLKNFALAKKGAVMSLYDRDNTMLMVAKLCAYFDKEIENIIYDELD
jgi:Leucine-rich repeat (LRR) protein